MTLVADVAARINTVVPDLKGRIEFVAGLAALVEEGALPQKEVAAFVVSLGFDDLGTAAATGMHIQMLRDSVGVVLCIKAAGDAKAKRAVAVVDDLKDAVINAVAGWAPGDIAGVFIATRGRLVTVSKGLVIYQIDFAIQNQLRIAA